MERLTQKLKSGVYAAKAPLYTMVDKLGKYEDLEEEKAHAEEKEQPETE